MKHHADPAVAVLTGITYRGDTGTEEKGGEGYAAGGTQEPDSKCHICARNPPLLKGPTTFQNSGTNWGPSTQTQEP